MPRYCYCDDEPDSFVAVKPIYNYDKNLHQNLTLDFQVDYTRVPEENSDGEDHQGYSNLETLRVYQALEVDKEWLIGGDRDRIVAVVSYVLELIDAPRYRDLVHRLTYDILQLKEPDAISALPNLERLEVEMDLLVYRFPGEEDADHENVKLAVAPASDEAVENHLETVVVKKEGYCVICMDKIRVGSDAVFPCVSSYSYLWRELALEQWCLSCVSCSSSILKP